VGRNETMVSAGLRSGYRRDIDGVRALAVTVVVLFHAGVQRLGGGFVGVDIFFVISGYLIGAHIYREAAEGRFSLARFYQRRAKRILPAMLCLLLLCYVLGLVLLSPGELRRFGQFAVAALLSASNIFAWAKSGYFEPSANQNPLLMTWTLAVEEQFYVFFPLLMMGFAWWGRRRKLAREPLRRLMFYAVLLLSAASLLACVVETPHRPTDTFFLIPYRAWELACGVLMALYEARPVDEAKMYGGSGWADVRSLLGLAAVLSSVFLYTSRTAFPGPGALLPVGGAGLLLSAPEAWLNRTVLSWAPMRWLGLVSYSWYLWHWPLLSFANIVMVNPPGRWTALALCGIALGLAAISYRFDEGPFRASRVPPKPLLWRYAIASSLLLLPALAMALGNGFPARYPNVAVQEMLANTNHVPCFGENSLIDTEGCLPKADGRRAIALIGDSHAMSLAKTIRTAEDKAGMRTLIMAHYECPPLPGIAPNRDAEFIASCASFSEMAIKRAADDPTVSTVVLSGWWASPLEDKSGDKFGYVHPNEHGGVSLSQSDDNFTSALDSAVRELEAKGKHVILVQDQETLHVDPQSKMKDAWMPVRGRLDKLLHGGDFGLGPVGSDGMYAAQNDHAARLVAAVAARDDAEVFDPRPALCPGGHCTIEQGGNMLYQDPHHLTLAGSVIALSAFPWAAMATTSAEPSAGERHPSISR
jgi:peptidoglycan/LPS O-acetylase OafA/YrhL